MMPEKKDERTLQDLAKEALAVQDAANLLAVINGYSRSLKRLRELLNNWDEADKHPISILWADKVAHLSGSQYNVIDTVGAAYAKASDIAFP